MNKSEIITTILGQLRDEFESRRSVSKRTREQGSDAESKSEGKYDTRSTEENYLADGLAKQALAAAQAAVEIEKLPYRDFSPDEPVDLGALVELEFPGCSSEWFFLAPAGGGTEVVHSGVTITVLTPDSPLGGRLLGCRAGERTTSPAAGIRSVR